MLKILKLSLVTMGTSMPHHEATTQCINFFFQFHKLECFSFQMRPYLINFKYFKILTERFTYLWNDPAIFILILQVLELSLSGVSWKMDKLVYRTVINYLQLKIYAGVWSHEFQLQILDDSPIQEFVHFSWDTW